MWSTPTDWTQFETAASSNTGVIQFIGQETMKERVEPFINADTFPHMLLTGEPGLGKSQFAQWVAISREIESQILTAPINKADLDVALWKPFVILDEAHKQKDSTWLFRLMEAHEYTFIATTNMPEKMDDAFRSRFVMQLRIAPYTVEDMAKIAFYYSYGECDDEAALSVFAAASAGNPRQARRIMDTARALNSFDPEEVLSTIRVTADGVTEEHIAYLTLLNKHDRPLGVSYIATMLYIDEKTIKYLERLLTDMDLVELSASGRKLTGRGRAYVHLLEERGLI